MTLNLARANNSIVPLDKIPYVDYPEFRINKNESTKMPFRYVKGENGKSILPEVYDAESCLGGAQS